MFNKRKQKQIEKKLEQQKRQYSDDVKEYLVENRETFMVKLATLCEKKNGRISYDAMEEMLDYKYPKASWLDQRDVKGQLILLFKEMGMLFKADETHLYFP